MWTRSILVAACLLGGAAVGLGAFQAHGLGKMLDQLGVSQEQANKRIDNCGTAVRYQMYHALAIFGSGVLATSRGRKIVVAPILMLAGVAAFSGGLYEIVFRGQATHFAIVPLGGLLLLGGWVALAVSCCLSAPGSNVENRSN